MEKLSTKKILAGLAASLFCMGAGAPAAAKYPERPITMVLPFSAGGPTDTIVRVIATEMSSVLAQQVIVKNVGGAGGTVGSYETARAQPDGYTLLFHHIGMATVPALYPDSKFDPLKDFSYIGLLGEGPAAIVGRKDLPPNDLKELLKYMKDNEPNINVANGGVGGASYLCAILLSHFTHTKVTYVPYQGMGPALLGMLGGQTDMACDITTSFSSYLDAGKLKGFATAAPERFDLVSQLPTTEEAGLPGFHFSLWFGMFAPKNTPDEAIETIGSALKEIMAKPEMIKKMAELGLVAAPPEKIEPAVLKKKLKDEIALWTPLIQEAVKEANQ